MIAKDYFKRQARTLRKLVRVTRNQAIADRLNLMADDFDHRSADQNDGLGSNIRWLTAKTEREEGHD